MGKVSIVGKAEPYRTAGGKAARDTPLCESHLPAFPILQELHRGVASRRSHYAAPGMRG
jgi:hypothetical protein